MRLDKYLADMCLGSRSEVKALVRQGQVRVNGVIVKDPAAAISPDDLVETGGRLLQRQTHRYYMLNKPAGILTATRDRNQRTVLDLFPEKLRKNLAPAGRLDKDTVGLLLITDDGALAHRLLSPRSHVEKRYFVLTSGEITAETAERFAEGMTLADGTALMSASLVPDQENTHAAVVTIREGKYHQIRRMFAACGNEVQYLKRLSMGSLTLDPELPEGVYRELTAEELAGLQISGSSPVNAPSPCSSEHKPG